MRVNHSGKQTDHLINKIAHLREQLGLLKEGDSKICGGRSVEGELNNSNAPSFNKFLEGSISKSTIPLTEHEIILERTKLENEAKINAIRDEYENRLRIVMNNPIGDNFQKLLTNVYL